MRLLAISCAAVAALALGSTANAAPVATPPSVATMDAALPVEQVRGGVSFYFGYGYPRYYGYGYGYGPRRYYRPRYYYGGYPYFYGPRFYRPWRGYRAWRRW
jgi:hypothetical protein